MRNDKLLAPPCPWACSVVRRAERTFVLWLAVFGSLDHKLADLLLYFPFPAFRALYLALLILTYGHYNFKRLFAVQTPVLVSRHGLISSSLSPGRDNLARIFCKDYSELRKGLSTHMGLTVEQFRVFWPSPPSVC
jgi:hypothetical protein